MAEPSTLEKLRQRKVIQWTIAYVAAAWVVAQVAEVLAEPWGMPLGWVRALHVVLIGGLPLALILAWYHGDRGHQRIVRSEAMLLALVVAGVALTLFSLDLEEASAPPVAGAKPPPAPARTGIISIPDSIPRLAVLAFSNLGAPADSFLADGITAELGSRLSGLAGLALLSPSSAKAFKGSDKSPREFGREMGADYVLFGNVLWDRGGDGQTRVRVIPEMIRVADDTQVWSAQLDRRFENTLAVQAEIALEVVERLRITLSAPERDSLGAASTDSPLAWEAYLKGIQVLPEGHGAEKDFRQARLLLEQAVSLDPAFVDAWVELAGVDFGLYWFGYDTLPERLERGLASVDRALEIDPESEDARLMLGEYYYRRREWDPALAEFSAVYQARPNDAVVLGRLGYLWRRQGLFEQGLEALERSAELDPLNAYMLVEAAYTHLFLRQDQRAQALVGQAQAVNPDEDWAYLLGVIVCWTAGGPDALACARKELQRFPEARSTYPAWFRVLQSLFEGYPEEALALIENYPEEALVMQHVYLPVELVRGMLLRATGRDLEGREALRAAVVELRREAETNPTDVRLYLGLGLAFAQLGDRDEAIRMAQRARTMMPPDRDALMWQDVAYSVAEIYALLGEDQRALDTMAEMLAAPTLYRGAWWLHNPSFERLREHPRFIALLETQES